MGILKNLTQIKSKKDVENTSNTGTLDEQRKTFHQDGHNSSKSCQGRPENLKTNLDAIYYKFENKCKEEDHEQTKLKQPYITELKGNKTTLLNKNDELGREKENLSEIETKIETLKKDIIKVRRNPSDFGIPVDKRSSAKFWVGFTLLAFLSIYIFIFYISTSFSAFFRTFNPATELFGGMFYPKALQEAYAAGPLELGFILFIPFVFFGLGYLIHMFQHTKSIMNIIKVAMLFAVTFLFDALLAYLIDEKLYNLNKTFEDPAYAIAVAFQSPSFWVIIFAGFISYIIWGLVFDFVMKEHADRDKVASFIQSIEDDISNLNNIYSKQKDLVLSLEKFMDEIKVRCTELENIIDGFILPIRNYKALSAEYLQGWQECISSKIALGHDETNQYLSESRMVYDNHVKKLDLDTDDYQNKVYRKTL
ncbi:MFS transporter [Ulvibacter antarcticus]|uniref:Beta-carotene 15,15'-monooxygenase n=1 Tax=Ulvibacter antarcticus TaxID=442714 RepID=A0A3L9Z0S5_9FLAO|nr:MFS transporter [Ulvibacter antarcticus]RMA66561.1 hypothetical protein BXY75_0988 [Ulvibacter antarcticus]